MNIERAIRSTRVVTPEGERPAAILVAGGKIVEVVAHDAVPAGVPLDDWGSLAILPGLVDTHVHCNEPGRTDWEGFEMATRSAIAGGITTIVDMPLNSSPVTTSVAAFEQKLAATTGKLWCDVGFWGGVVPGNGADIEPLIQAGVLGFKAFLCDSGIDEFPNVTETELRQAMQVIGEAGLPLLIHAELVDSAIAHSVDASPTAYSTWLAGRPADCEENAILQMLRLADDIDCDVHIVHLADGAFESVLLDYERQGRRAFTIETCPHYLHFAAEEIPDGATECKCAPPIRSRENRERLWKMLAGGLIEMVVSDHSPCPPEMKQRESGDFLRAWGGIASLQLGASIVWTGAVTRGGSMVKLSQWMSSKPAELARLAGFKGAIARGFDADLAVFEPDKNWNVDVNQLFHRHKLTPYDGERLHGMMIGTYLRGELIYRDGKFVDDQPNGKTILRTV